MTRARTTFTPATDGHQSWRLPVDHPTAETGAATGATPAEQEEITEMTTQNMQAQSPSRHLTAARQLLDEVGAATQGPESDAQAKATAAAAHAILVLAEQVAAARLTMAHAGRPQPQQAEGTA